MNGKPRPVPVAHLGSTADLFALLQAAEPFRARSLSHGAVAALHSLSQELDVAGTIDRHLAKHGPRVRPSQALPKMASAPKKNDGLTVGQSLALIAIGRACHATSKRGFAAWAGSTTLGELASAPVERLSSQHFWDQMDQLPVEAVASIERELVGRVLARLELPVDTLLFDATNFFTFIASTNSRPKLPRRGHNKQKRTDLRQVGVALLCSRQGGIPLWHQTYGGQVADARCFAEVLPTVRQRLVDLQRDIGSMTVVYDKGNVSRANQNLVDSSGLHYVTGMTVASQRELVNEANPLLAPVELAQDDLVLAWRTRRKIWGTERTAVVLVSERLREGQIRGIQQHVASVSRWLSALADTLCRGKQKRDRARIQRDIESHLKGRQHLARVMRYQLTGDDPKLTLTWEFDSKAFDALANETLGRLVLITDREDWSTAEIIRTYRDQADIEAVFAHLKDPVHLALRPQFHWTDQKLHVHVFTCMLGYLLARALYLRARATGYVGSMESLLDTLERVRRVTVIRQPTQSSKPRVTTQLEDIDPSLLRLMEALKIAA